MTQARPRRRRQCTHRPQLGRSGKETPVISMFSVLRLIGEWPARTPCRSNHILPGAYPQYIAGADEHSSCGDNPAARRASSRGRKMDPHQTRERIFHPTYVRLLCAYIRSHGVPPALALDRTGITWPQLLREQRLVPLEIM